MYNKLELAKVHVKANIEDPGRIFYGIRAALLDGSERFKLTNAELVELHSYARELAARPMPRGMSPTSLQLR